MQQCPTSTCRPSITVIICSYDPDRYQQLQEAITSLLQQSHRPDEIIVVISGSSTLNEKFCKDYSGCETTKLVFSEQSLSATQARNKGIRHATSEILAFTDDDIIADSNWIASLIEIYTTPNIVAVGGKVLPLWLTNIHDHLPEELYWLVGVTHESTIPDEMVEIRNTFGPNMSFRRSVFEKVGFFNETLGFAKRGTVFIQGEEPEFGLRMIEKIGKGIVYNPHAIIYHKVPSHKLTYAALFKRSFYQGYSKSIIQRQAASLNIFSSEKIYLKKIAFTYIPQRFAAIFHGTAKISQAKKLFVLLASVALVGAGFIYGQFRNIFLK